MKQLRSYFLVTTIFSVVLLSCSSEEPNQAQNRGWGQAGGNGTPTSVEVLPVTTSSISDQLRSFGTIRAQDVVNINPQVSNRITNIYADLGDTVRQGQVLAKIYDVPFRDTFEQAQAQLRQSRSAFTRDSTQFVRQQQLFESRAISSVEFENARATYETSRAQLESSRAALTQSRENLENTEIKSPVNGVIMNRFIVEGDIAQTGQSAFEIANLVGFETRLYMPYQDWDAVRVGLPVELSLSNRPGNIARGTISRISPQLNENTGLGEVVVSLTDVTPAVRQGVLAESRVTLETRENTVVIPRTAMIESVETYIEPETNTVELRRNYSVFVTQGDTIAIQRQLTLGLEQGERVEILEGLQEGDKMVVTGQSNLRNRSNIRIAGQQRQNAQQDRQIDTMERSGSGEGASMNREQRRQQGGVEPDSAQRAQRDSIRRVRNASSDTSGN